MSEKGKQLLALKGVEEEKPPEPIVDSSQVLEDYQKRRAFKVAQRPEWDELEADWNSDRTLDRLVVSKGGEVLCELSFVWNADGTFSKI